MHFQFKRPAADMQPLRAGKRTDHDRDTGLDGDLKFGEPIRIDYEPNVPQLLHMMMYRKRATPEETAQGENKIRRANECMEEELATGIEP